MPQERLRTFKVYGHFDEGEPYVLFTSDGEACKLSLTANELLPAKGGKRSQGASSAAFLGKCIALVGLVKFGEAAYLVAVSEAGKVATYPYRGKKISVYAVKRAEVYQVSRASSVYVRDRLRDHYSRPGHYFSFDRDVLNTSAFCKDRQQFNWNGSIQVGVSPDLHVGPALAPPADGSSASPAAGAHPLASQLAPVCIFGFVKQSPWIRIRPLASVSSSSKLEGSSSAPGPGDLARYTILSRRSAYRAGRRFHRRGVDADGHCANFIETEFILEVKPAKGDLPARQAFSFVTIRATLPLPVRQIPNLTAKPKAMWSARYDSYECLARHFDGLRAGYEGREIVCVNLLDNKGRERIISRAVERLLCRYLNGGVEALQKAELPPETGPTAQSPDLEYETLEHERLDEPTTSQAISAMTSGSPMRDAKLLDPELPPDMKDLRVPRTPDVFQAKPAALSLYSVTVNPRVSLQKVGEEYSELRLRKSESGISVADGVISDAIDIVPNAPSLKETPVLQENVDQSLGMGASLTASATGTAKTVNKKTGAPRFYTKIDAQLSRFEGPGLYCFKPIPVDPDYDTKAMVIRVTGSSSMDDFCQRDGEVSDPPAGNASDVASLCSVVVQDAAQNRKERAGRPVTYCRLDFHSIVSHTFGGNIMAVSAFLADVHARFIRMPYLERSSSSGTEVFCDQPVLYRINCMDSLDRTNVTQMCVIREYIRFILQFFREESCDLRGLFSCLSADFQEHGNTLSNHYSGTDAMKADITATGRRTMKGRLQDLRSWYVRWHMNNFRDGRCQDEYNIVLGRTRKYSPELRLSFHAVVISLISLLAGGLILFGILAGLVESFLPYEWAYLVALFASISLLAFVFGMLMKKRPALFINWPRFK